MIQNPWLQSMSVLRNGRQLDSVAPTQLAINPNLWDDKDECVKNESCLQ